MNAWCITLKQTPERTAAARAHLAARDVSANFWQGIHGKSWGLRTERFRGNDKAYSMSPGHVGLCLSHWMLWQHLLYMPGDSFLVMEDDVILPEDFHAQYETTFSSLPPDWKLWYVGTVGGEDKEREPVNERLCRFACGAPFGTHCYAVRRSALPILLDRCAVAYTHIDISIIDKALPSLSWYVSWPPIARQHTWEKTWSRTV